MKRKIQTLLLILFAGVLLASCASTGTRDDYFGYNNHPKLDEDNTSAGEEYDWDNPLGTDYNGKENFTVNYNYNNMPPSYIPVVVPWYAGYNSWYNAPFSGFYIGYGYSPYPYYDWYSPFYVHCPYYYNPHVYYGGNRWWDWYPYDNGSMASNDRPKKTYRIRDFGPHRGTYTTSGKPYAGGSSSSSGRTGDRSRKTISGNSGSSAGPGAQKRITYKPVTPVSSTSSGFGKSRSSGRSPKHRTYDKNSKTYSPVGNTSGFGSSSGSSFGGSSSGGSKSSGSSSGSGKSSSGSRSSSPRSSGRGR